MPNREDDLARDERDAVSAELLLKKLREGLEQQPSKKNESGSKKVPAAQISEETVKLAQSEIIRGKPEEFGSDEFDEVKLRELMNMPMPEKKSEANEIQNNASEDENKVLKDAVSDVGDLKSMDSADIVESGIFDAADEDMSEAADADCLKNSASDDSDPWYDDEEEALSKTVAYKPVSENASVSTYNYTDDEFVYPEKNGMEAKESDGVDDGEVDKGFLAEVAKIFGEDGKRDYEPLKDEYDDFDFVEDTEAIGSDDDSKNKDDVAQISDDGGREYSGLNGSEMNSTEMSLLSLFGNREELEEAYGKERADEIIKASNELKVSQAPKKKKFYELFASDFEYTDTEQNDEIKKKYTSAFKSATVRFLLCIIFAGALFLFENVGLFGLSLPSILDVSVYPTVCAMIDLQLVFLCALMMIDKLAIGFASLIRLKPTLESVPVLLLIASAVYTVIITVSPGTRNAVFYNFPVALSFVFTLLYEIMNLKREAMSFDVISGSHRKYTIRRLTDEERAEDAKLFEEYVPAGSAMFAVTKTGFVDGFFERIRGRSKNKYLPVLILIALAEMLLAAGLGILMKADTLQTVTMAYLALVLGLPGTILIAGSHPFYRASKSAFDGESAIIGEASLEEYSDGSVVFFDDRDIFPSTGVKINSVKVYGENRIDGVIYYAASVFSKIGGPLSDVFSLATIEIGHSENVEVLESGNCGLHCTIDGESIYIGSNEYMKSMDFETPYGESDEAVENNGVRLMYIASEQEILAKFYVQYSVDLEYEIIFKQLYKAGMCVGIRTRDPNINDEFVMKKLKLKSDYPVRVVHGRPGKEFVRKCERTDSGVASAGSVKSLLRTLSLCDRVKYIAKIHGIFEIVSTVLVIFVIYAVTALGKLGLGSAYAALYQLFWLIPIMLATVFTE